MFNPFKTKKSPFWIRVDIKTNDVHIFLSDLDNTIRALEEYRNFIQDSYFGPPRREG